MRVTKMRCALLASTIALGLPATAFAQDAEEEPVANPEAQVEGNAIVVTGILSSLASALNEQRNADSLVEVIQAEDIGKLPDQNLAEVLENIPGVQITRRAGVGSGVQIRGTNDNRTEINGVGTVGSGTGRGGIDFEDVNAAIIASLEVTKSPTAQTIEGSVGGTINLRTIRPLDLTERLVAFRVQGEYSELSDSVSPRISGSFGNSWDTGIGEIGIVLSGSYAEQEATSFRPRVDRDTLVPQGSVVDSAGNPGPNFDFIGIQFLNQELENFEYETINFAGTLEYAPSNNLKFYFDTIISDQERRQDSSRIQASGVSSVLFNNVPDAFETINYGTLDGVDLGSIQGALTGTIAPNLASDDDDPNLRFSSDTGARLTTSQLYILGTEFSAGRFSARIEASRTTSSTVNPNLSTTLNFINPNAPLNRLDANGNPTNNTSNDNAVPFRYDLSGGSLAFGINFDSPFAPTIEQLLDPSNVVLDAVTVGRDTIDNAENAARIDTSLDLEDLTGFITSVDAGYRYSKRSSTFNDIGTTSGFSRLFDSPNGSLFADLLVPGPSNFGDADGRTLAFRNFLLIDPDRSFSDPEGTLDAIQAAFLQTENGVVIGEPSASPDAFFDIDETTHAVYGQVNFEFGVVRGNIGARWVDTAIASVGNTVFPDGTVTSVTTRGNYTEFLPRLNVIADLTDDLVLRASWGEDINRPDFNDLSSSVSFGTSSTAPVRVGNPNLAPETVTSYDASLAWYFAPAAVLSVGAFYKERTNIFVTQLDEAEVRPGGSSGLKDITPPCEGGGIFNPIADQGVFVTGISEQGICVDLLTQTNDSSTTKQKGIEVAFQYDLSSFEDTLGFASGFGVVANYTYQDFSGGEAVNQSSARGTTILESSSGLTGPFTAVQGLLDFSKNAYNVTLFYEKYGLSARARYTWRDSFRTLDTAGGASLGSTLGFPTVTGARGQLNASISYDLTDYINIGVEGVNLMKDDIEQFCVNDGAQFCFQGLPDRRITFGANVRF
ncbi:TonB-dependent receptor [Erythrobacter longus]|uniref:TonB-dependent receptor n=1 Tax=Erythrobacter longus TaxID=1044 RepID=A0A074M728_ERYLO|nr:TonB-dependent receptor [Erythrobacter longus]